MDDNTITYLYTGGQPDYSDGVGITHVIVEDGVTSINYEAFAWWTYLISVHIPPSVTNPFIFLDQ